jgi:hypothetical protein
VSPRAPWRRRVGTAPKSWVAVMAVGVCVGWLPFVGRALSPDEAGYLIVGGQWAPGTSLYGDYWVDRPPALIAVFALADWLGGAVPLRVLGAIAAALTVVLSGVLGRLAAPERRSAPLLTAGTAAVCVATPLFGGSEVNGELLGMPFLVAGLATYVAAAASPSSSRGFGWALVSGASAAVAVSVKQSLVDVVVLAGVLVLTSGNARRRLPGFLVGALVTLAVVLALSWARGTPPADVWDAAVSFRLDAARELARENGESPRRLVALVAALLASGLPLVVGAFVWKGRGAPSVQGPWTAPDLRIAAYVVLAVELLTAFLGGSYWLHYLLGLVPGAVLVAAAFAQRPAPVTRSIGISFALAGLSSAIAVGWVVAQPIERPERGAVDYLAAHAAHGDTGVVVLGAADVLHAGDLASPYPFLWSLPARVRDRDLSTLEGVLRSPARPTWVVLARSSMRSWGLDLGTTQGELDASYEQVAKRGRYEIYRRVR